MRHARVCLVAALLAPLAACALHGPPVLIEREFAAGASFTLDWPSTGSPQELWIRLKVNGGRDLSGPVRVLSGDAEIAAGRFSLEKEGIVERDRTLTEMTVSTAKSWRGQIQLFVLPDVPAGAPLHAVIELQSGSSLKVSQLALQVRSEQKPAE